MYRTLSCTASSMSMASVLMMESVPCHTSRTLQAGDADAEVDADVAPPQAKSGMSASGRESFCGTASGLRTRIAVRLFDNGFDLQCLDGVYGGKSKRWWTPARNAICHTHARGSSEQVWGPNGILECKFLSKARTVPQLHARWGC
jgi:hypothetical protein